LSGVYPNPFRNSTNIEFELPQRTHVVLEVYSMIGERVVVITDQSYDKGKHFIKWNAQKLKNGMYFLRLKAGEMVDTRRLILMP
ncbi:MAG TPA: T9SS type A sorting domain-containing protein, partial [Bacteroidales bacterium]|nr:T9SS type A sorting domain-containing protein [Bacteroidales bacterium]